MASFDKTLRVRVVVRVGAPAHRDQNASRLQPLDILPAAVLHAAVGMMHQTWFILPLAQGLAARGRGRVEPKTGPAAGPAGRAAAGEAGRCRRRADRRVGEIGGPAGGADQFFKTSLRASQRGSGPGRAWRERIYAALREEIRQEARRSRTDGYRTSFSSPLLEARPAAARENCSPVTVSPAHPRPRSATPPRPGRITFA